MWLYVVTQTPHLFLFSSIELLTPAQGTECFVLSGQQTADPAPRRLCLGTVSLYTYVPMAGQAVHRKCAVMYFAVSVSHRVS